LLLGVAASTLEQVQFPVQVLERRGGAFQGFDVAGLQPVVRYDQCCVDAHLWLHDFGSHDVPEAQH
jgi:hypothetical protein